MSQLLLGVLEIELGSPVMVKSVGMGIHVGLLAGCDGRAVALRDARHMREWRDVGGAGSLYDLARGKVRPTSRGPVIDRQLVLDADGLIPLSAEEFDALAGE